MIACLQTSCPNFYSLLSLPFFTVGIFTIFLNSAPACADLKTKPNLKAIKLAIVAILIGLGFKIKMATML